MAVQFNNRLLGRTVMVLPAGCPVRPSVNYHFVKMFITLEPHNIFLSHFEYICMSIFPYNWHV